MVFIKLDKTCCVFEIFLRSKLRAADRESKVGILYLVWPYSGFIHWQPPASSHGAITYIHATIWPTFPTSIILDCVFKAQIFYKHQHPHSKKISTKGRVQKKNYGKFHKPFPNQNKLINAKMSNCINNNEKKSSKMVSSHSQAIAPRKS